jgi:ABC-type multidrug transport system ATPase subunit
VTRICSHVAILRAGRLARVGPLADVLAPRDEVLIETAPLRPAVAAALGTLATEIADGRIWLRGDAVARKADVLRLLLDEGIEINGLTQERASLEEVYLEAVGG